MMEQEEPVYSKLDMEKAFKMGFDQAEYHKREVMYQVDSPLFNQFIKEFDQSKETAETMNAWSYALLGKKWNP